MMRLVADPGELPVSPLNPTAVVVDNRRQEGQPMTEAEWLACEDPEPIAVSGVELVYGKSADDRRRVAGLH